MNIREAILDDHTAVWKIFKSVIETGENFVFDPKTKKESLGRLWFGDSMKTYVVVEDTKILGSYYIKPNQPGLGSHIANCGYMVNTNSLGKGVGKLMCAHSIENSTKMGYKAIQFNMVVSSNKIAVKLWESFGFKIIGTIPDGFKHAKKGYVDTYIMHRKL